MAKEKKPDKPRQADKGVAAVKSGEDGVSGPEQNSGGPGEVEKTGKPESGRAGGRTVVALAATLGAVVVAYLGYDLLRGQFNECETIFQQSQTSIQANLEVIKSKGSLIIGPQKNPGHERAGDEHRRYA